MRFQRVVVSGLVLTLAMSSAAAAQRGPEKAHFGVFGGASFDKPGGPDATNVDGTYTGFGVGGFIGLHVTPGFAIQPEVLYVVKGAKFTDPGGSGRVKVSYLEVPVFAKLRIPMKGTSIVSPHLYAGPALGFKASCKLKFTETGGTLHEDSCGEGDFQNNNIKSTDFSLAFGGGVDVGRALIDARYVLGLSKVGDNTAGGNDFKNRSFYLLAGWTFRAP